MATYRKPKTRDEFAIAIICALSRERDAVMEMLDEHWKAQDYGQAIGDSNTYKMGRIRPHNVIVVHLPGMGPLEAASTAAHFGSSFTKITLGLVVGICGGVPTKTASGDIILGDVIISKEIIDYTFGRQHDNNFSIKDALSDRYGQDDLEKAATTATEEETRRLRLTVKHADICASAEKLCCKDLGCDVNRGQVRGRTAMIGGTDIREPEIHFGKIGSGNSVLKSGYLRDELAKNGIIAFEMEGAGVWDNFPTVVIKAVCDYADGHKNKDWQDFAAASAAACMKAFLMEWAAAGGVQPSIADANVNAKPAFPVYSTVSRTTNTLFTGRRHELYELESIIKNAVENKGSRSPCHIVISGMGGQGKSEICLQLIHRLRNLFWGIFWVDVSTATLAEIGFLNLASRLDVVATTWESARQWLANVQQPWLLVLDNADDHEMDYSGYFPTGTFGVVLLTSRNPECKLYATNKWLDLEGLSPGDAQGLLFRTAGTPETQHKSLDVACRDVVAILGLHPRAIIQAGSYIARQKCSFRGYCNEFEKQRKRILTYRMTNPSERHRDIYATFEVSAEHLKMSATETATDALQVLSLLAMYGPRQLPIDLFQAAWEEAQRVPADQVADDDLYTMTVWHVTHLPGILHSKAAEWDRFRLQEALALLEAFSLVSYDRDATLLSVTMHPLVHAWARDRLTREQQHQSWVRAACIVALSRQWADIWETHARQLQPHLQAITSCPASQMLGSEPRLEICRVLLYCGQVLETMRDNKSLLKLTNDLRAYLGLKLSDVNFQWLDVFELTARSLLRSGLYSDAVGVLEQIVVLRKQIPAKDQSEQFVSEHMLANAYRDTGRTQDAIKILEHIVEMENALDDDDPDRIASQHSLAVAYQENGQIQDALRILENVVKIRNKLAKTHPDRLISLHALAVAYKGNTKGTGSFKMR